MGVFVVDGEPAAVTGVDAGLVAIAVGAVVPGVTFVPASPVTADVDEFQGAATCGVASSRTAALGTVVVESVLDSV